jgi:hypothetical protein
MAGTCGESVRSAWTNNFRAQAERPAQIMCSIGGPWLAVLSLDPRSDQQLSSIWIPSNGARRIYFITTTTTLQLVRPSLVRLVVVVLL